MNKGLTFLETIIIMSFISLFTLILTFMIATTKSNIETQFVFRKIENEIIDFENSFNMLIEQYDNSIWEIKNDKIETNGSIILILNGNEYEFIFKDGIKKIVTFSINTSLLYVNSNLIKFSLLYNNRNYERYFFIGGHLIGN